MVDELTTKPTMETLLEMMRGVRDEMRERFDRLETQLDRVSSVTHETRADLRDLKRQLKEHLPALK